MAINSAYTCDAAIPPQHQLDERRQLAQLVRQRPLQVALVQVDLDDAAALHRDAMPLFWKQKAS